VPEVWALDRWDTTKRREVKLTPGRKAARAALGVKQAPLLKAPAKRVPHKSDLRLYRRDHQGRFRDAKEF